MKNIIIVLGSLVIVALSIWVLFVGSPAREYEYEKADPSEILAHEQSMKISRDKLAKSCEELGGTFAWDWSCDTGDFRRFYANLNDEFEETHDSKQCAQYADYKRIDLPVRCEKYPY